jgi:hypothetical protein
LVRGDELLDGHRLGGRHLQGFELLLGEDDVTTFFELVALTAVLGFDFFAVHRIDEFLLHSVAGGRDLVERQLLVRSRQVELDGDRHEAEGDGTRYCSSEGHDPSMQSRPRKFTLK